MIKNILITEKTNIYQVMQKLQKTGEKCLIVVDKNKRLLGTINDGDIRRAILDQIPTSTNIQKIYEKQCVMLKIKTIKWMKF